METPEVLQKWNEHDWNYFVNSSKPNAFAPYDFLETMYYAIIKFLEYACQNDMRLEMSTDYSTIGALRYDREVYQKYRLYFREDSLTMLDIVEISWGSGVKLPRELEGTGCDGYIELQVNFDHETDLYNSINEVRFGNVFTIRYKCPGEYEPCGIGDEKKKIRLIKFIDKIKSYVRAHDDINAWLILQGVNLSDD